MKIFYNSSSPCPIDCFSKTPIEWSTTLMTPDHYLATTSFSIFSIKAPDGEYGLGSSDSEIARLRRQTNLYDGCRPSGCLVLGLIKEGDNLLDLGCGTGDLAVTMAKRTGNAGVVVGIDIDETKLSLAHQIAAKEGVSNVVFETGNAYKLNFPDDSFDIVHIRLLLMHMKDPISILKEAKRVLKPGGNIVVVESADKLPLFNPVAVTYENIRKRVISKLENQGIDWGIGGKMVELLTELGFSNIIAENISCNVKNSDNPSLFRMNFDNVAPLFRRGSPFIEKFGPIATPDEFDEVKRELESLLNNPDAEYKKIIIGVVATKPMN